MNLPFSCLAVPPTDLKTHLRKTGLVLASANRHKIVEFQRMLQSREIEVISAADLGLDLDVAETADSFHGNAALKAVQYFRHAGRPVIADDSGLAVDALGGAPGVFSARYGGPGLDDAGRRRYLLAELARVGALDPTTQRRGRFICVLALCLGISENSNSTPGDSDREKSESEPEKNDLLYFEGAAEGRILETERGQGGFGYDPVFLDVESGRSFAELSPEEKDARSHRGVALRKFLRAL